MNTGHPDHGTHPERIARLEIRMDNTERHNDRIEQKLDEQTKTIQKALGIVGAIVVFVEIAAMFVKHQ